MYQYEYPHPAVTTDAVVFALRDDKLNVLLIQRANDPHAGSWAFPGGFVEIDESLDAAVHRELQEETGISDVELEQFHTFGAPGRDPRERVITVAYLGVAAADAPEPQAADDARDARWAAIDSLPPLAFDHQAVLASALASFRLRIETCDVAMGLMGEHFTISDVQRAYEIIMGDQLDAAIFRDWLLGQGWLEQTGEFTEPDPEKPS